MDMCSQCAVDECPFCHSITDEPCKPDCPHKYRQEAGTSRNDGGDYLRNLWAEYGAPNMARRNHVTPR